MSSVLERFRNISEMQFYETAQTIRHEIRTFLLNDKNIPKKYRSIYTYPIFNLVQEMIDYMVEANSIYTFTTDKVIERKQKFQNSINCIDKIYERLQGAIADVWWETLHSNPGDPGFARRLQLEDHICKIAVLLVEEEKLLKGCKEKTKLLNRH